MTIPSFKILKKNAAERVAAAEKAPRIALIYAGAVTVLALLVTVINYVLNLQIAQLGGLSNMGLRTQLQLQAANGSHRCTILHVLPTDILLLYIGYGSRCAESIAHGV